MSASSEDNIGLNNYARKVNFRRMNGGEEEGRREGWVKFRPNTDLAQGTQATPPAGPITLIAENVRPNSERCVIAASQTTIYRYTYSTGAWTTIGSGYSASGKRWQTETINGWIIFNNGVDLPCSYRVEDGAVVPLKELREVGIASVKVVTQLNGFLMCMNVREIKAASLNAVMNSGSPYGLVDDSLVNHIPYRIIWGEPAAPTNWAPVFNVTMASASATITLPFPSAVFVQGVTRVAVINGGPNGGTLGGDTANPDGILVTGVAGAVLTLAVATSAVGNTYPRTVSLTRWADTSALSGYIDIQGNASHITCAKPLQGLMVVYRQRGIYVGRYTGNADEPFQFSERPDSFSVPAYPDAVASVAGEYHVYPAKGGFFYAFDGVNAPSLFAPLNDCANLIMDGLTPSSTLWAVEQPLTKETWFCRADRTLCFDHETKTVSEIDAAFGAAALVARPGWEDDWFIMAQGSTLYTYGRINDVATTFLRDGVNPGGRLVWGRAAFGDVFNEKMLRSYLMLFGSGQTAVPMRLKLFGAFSSSSAREALLDEVIPDPTVDGGMIPTAYQSVYFQDELHIESEAFHSADYDRNWFLGANEIARITALFHYQSGTTRTGQYHTDLNSVDGFAPGPGPIEKLHSADTDMDGRISLLELTRMIELSNGSGAYSSIGFYHLQGGEVDGYAPGPRSIIATPVDADVNFIGRLFERAAIRSAGTTRNA